jgi:hypothetical protein
MNTKGIAKVLAVAMLLAALVLTSLPAFAIHDLGLFELDRNAIDSPTVPGDDWSTLYAGGGSAKAFTGILPDIGADGGTQFQGGGSKDVLDIPDWLWKTGEPLDKDDITNAYAAAYLNTTDTGNNNVGDLILYYGLDRFSANGSAQVGFWFLQDPNFGLTNTPAGGGFKFSGVHQNNDILVQSNFSQGGVIDRITVYKWLNGALVQVYSAADCLGPPGSPSDDAACATVNQSPQTAPWPYTPKANEGSPGTFLTGGFFEGGINISRLIPDAGCFTGFIAETRTSTPFDARLKDFVRGTFDVCSIKVTKTGDTLSKVGDPVDYSVAIENTGALPLYKDDISDTLLGNITINGVDQANPYVQSNSCGASLVSGASCTITLRRTVQAGDPDPLPNTATAVYRGKSDLSGSAVSGSDDHSVNLFQPSITFDKSVDSHLSKVGDGVKYTLTLKNTSSSDTPDLVCTVSDPKLGISKNVTLASGGQDVTNKSYTFQDGDPDPYDNTATASCSPTGFPNVLTKSDSESVNLFQPAIDVAKTGDTLSKVGDPVDYTFTLSNNSSADTPAMNCTASDDLLGTVFDGVLPLGDTVIHKSRTVLQNDPDPLVNTVTLTCSPDGFPNVLTASASHSTNLFQPSITFDKSVSSHLSKVGDAVMYTLTLNNTSSSDTPDLVCTVSDPTLDVSKNVTLASGGQDVTTKSYTFQTGDSDPYDNTATASCSPTGFPNVLTKSDSESVNLFQPAIAAAKTGDTLSKVGDAVNYTFTLSNNSSSDTPAMNCTASDDLLGSIFNGVLPLGDTVIHKSRTVLQTDPDPLDNTLSLTCSPDGFPNVLKASASHSTNLFQPGVEVIKGGPSTASRGQTITYNFTINNLSSIDGPNLILDSVTDTVLGDLTATASANGCGSLAPGGSCSFTFDYTIQNTDPSPLVNVVTVHYHPDGFPNDITDNDSHSVQIPILGCTPGFWQGGAGSQLWDQVNDPQWIYNGTNPYIHTTLFNSFFNVVTDSRLNGLTMYDLVSTGGGSDSAVKAARDMVAAYLNESAFPADFPATSLADLTAMWYAAVQGGDPALDAFHNLVSGWNSPASPGYCPLP